MFKVEWTGSYPNLCRGKWKISKNGIDVSSAIPKELISSEMNTYGSYEIWDVDDGWETCADGLECNEWMDKNPWINTICDTKEEKQELYNAIQDQDWRHNSCGGLYLS